MASETMNWPTYKTVLLATLYMCCTCTVTVKFKVDVIR